MRTFMFNHPIAGERNVSEMGIPSLFQLYLISSYVYYKVLDNILPDHVYDEIANILLRNYQEVEAFQLHFHGKILVTEGDLRAGTLYALSAGQYPDRVRVAADMWLRDKWNKELEEGG